MPSDSCEIRGIETCLMELLHSIQTADVEAYLCRVSEDVSCFEPETRGHLLRGLGLHRYLVEKSAPVENYHIELIDPLIRVSGDMAFIAYTLHLTEIIGNEEQICAENVTRIFQKENFVWKMVHFHRSLIS